VNLAPQPLYFWHIPKTAGTAFTGWLESHFGPGELFQPHLLPDLRGCSDSDLGGKLLFRGHFGRELPRRLPAGIPTVTLLREPRARTVSHLAHIWRAPDHYLHQRIHLTGGQLAAVLADPVLRMSVSDMQARYLALDPTGTHRTQLPVSVPAHLLGQAQYELAPLPSATMLSNRAVRRLHRLTDFGFAEDLDGFATRLARRFGWPEPGPLPRSNVAPADSSPWSLRQMTPAELLMLDELNRADNELYRRARTAAGRRGRRSDVGTAPRERAAQQQLSRA
jgi:hypothetical protein